MEHLWTNPSGVTATAPLRPLRSDSTAPHPSLSRDPSRCPCPSTSTPHPSSSLRDLTATTAPLHPSQPTSHDHPHPSHQGHPLHTGPLHQKGGLLHPSQLTSQGHHPGRRLPRRSHPHHHPSRPTSPSPSRATSQGHHRHHPRNQPTSLSPSPATSPSLSLSLNTSHDQAHPSLSTGLPPSPSCLPHRQSTSHSHLQSSPLSSHHTEEMTTPGPRPNQTCPKSPTWMSPARRT